MMLRSVLWASAISMMLGAIVPARAYEACGELQNAYGPYDFWTEYDKIRVVEGFHFNSNVENLRSGQSGVFPGGDLDYVLRAVPNHPRALVSMMNLAIKEKSPKARGATYTIDCYFDRALRFRPNDGMARLIFGTYLMKRGKVPEAIVQLEAARESGVSTGNFFYNLGLAYFEAKQYEKSLEAAHKAYERGFNLPGLKKKLTEAGKWRDAPLPAGSEAAAPKAAEVSPRGGDEGAGGAGGR